MNQPKYALSIYGESGNHNYLDWNNLDSLPRFEVGDQLDATLFDPISDMGRRWIVTDAHYGFIDGGEERTIFLSLRVRPETDSEHYIHHPGA